MILVIRILINVLTLLLTYSLNLESVNGNNGNATFKMHTFHLTKTEAQSFQPQT